MSRTKIFGNVLNMLDPRYIKVLAAVAGAGAGTAITYHQSLTPIEDASKTMFAAAGGLLFEMPMHENVTIKDNHRQLLEDSNLSLEVQNVNRYCAERNIPLSGALAILFIFQHKMNVEKGSAVDIAFEKLIIQEFLEEYKKGALNLGEVEKLLNPEEAERIDTFNLIGVAAHSSYLLSKAILFGLGEAISNPNILHTSRYGSSPDRASLAHDYGEKIDLSLKNIIAQLDGNSTKEDYHRVIDQAVSVLRNDIKTEIKTTQTSFKDALSTIKNEADKKNAPSPSPSPSSPSPSSSSSF